MYNGPAKFRGYFQSKVQEIRINHPRISFLDGFSQGFCSGYFDIVFKLEQPFSVTDGIERKKDNKILLKMYRVQDKILIPGSSLKGAIRTYFEAVFGKEFAQRVFGSTEIASLVYFNDVLIDSKALLSAKLISYQPYPEQFGKEPKRRIKDEIRLYTKKASEEYPKDNLPYFVEHISGQFTTRIIFKAMPKKYLIALLVLLGIINTINKPIYLKIGRGKNVGMGLVSIQLKNGVNYLQKDDKKIFSYSTIGLRKEDIVSDNELKNLVEQAVRKLTEIQRSTMSN